MTTETAAILDRVWHLLNIRVGTRKASGRRADLPEVRVQSVRLGIDELDHVFAVTRQSLLYGAIFEQRSDDWILSGEWLELPVACRIRNGNAEPVERLGQLLL